MARDSRGFDDDVRSLVWFLGGLGVGAVAALLFAPQTGKQTRRMIGKAAERGLDYLDDTAEDIRDSATDLVDRAAGIRDDIKKSSRDIYSRGRDLARDAGEDAATLLDRGKKIVRG